MTDKKEINNPVEEDISTDKKKIILTWKDVEDLVNNLCIQIIDKYDGKIKYVGGIDRGGLIPAVMISHALDIEYIPNQIWPRHPLRTLIVDDICDSGETLKRVNHLFKKHYGQWWPTAVLYNKPGAVAQPDMYAKIHRTDEWIVFPWETIDSETIQDYKRKQIGDESESEQTNFQIIDKKKQ